MNESLQAVCSEFEQTLLAGMFRSAGFGKSLAEPGSGSDGDGDAVSDATPRSDATAFADLVVRALSSALERAGGAGLARSLAAALERAQS